ncbi:hypothetical protein GCM10023189_57800 [Nibrella saemangeumensis]|uniref:OmpA-like domain-containing protein n=1 Tax=Nibrella saemangeumensis TaxID=1084526 RepID=A0ABP8NRR8_9BACT
MNFFNTIDEVLNPEIASKIALYVDELNEKARKATEAQVYVVFGGMLKRTTTEIGVDQLYNKIKRGHYDGHLVANLNSTLKDAAQTHAFITTGNEDISHLLPAMKSSIGNMVSRYANIRNSSAISLLGLVTAVVLDVLGRHVKEKNLDADGLAAYLFDQREAFVNAVPEELLPQLIEKLSLHQIVAGVAAPAKRVNQVSAATRVASPRTTTTRTIPTPVTFEPEVESGDNAGSLAKWGVGILLLLVVAAGGYYIWKNTERYSDGSEEVSGSSTLSSDTIKADTVARSLAVPPAPGATTPARSTSVAGASPVVSTTAARGPLSDQLTPYLSNPTAPKGRVFTLPAVAFQPGTMDLAPSSQAAITELVNILRTHPNAQIQLVGYANDASSGTGLTNMDLSRKRAYAIKQQLLNAGIDNNRVDAVGKGTGVTITPGDSTAVRRPTMRKIDVRVVLK